MNQASAAKLSNKNGKITWPKVSSIKQNFSLPSSIIYYITKNPSTSKFYLKMVKSCKYFFEKNPILIVAHICYNGKIICSNGENCLFRNLRKCCVKIDIKKITKSKIWLTKAFNIFNISKIAYTLVPKLYRCEKAVLGFISHQMKFNEFKLWASVFHIFNVGDVKIIDDDGKVVPLDTMLEAIPQIKELTLCIDDEIPVTASTMKNILKLQNFKNLQKFQLFNIPEIIDVADIKKLILAHTDSKFHLSFNCNISDGYKIQLDQLIDTVISDAIHFCLISYLGQDRNKLKVMKTRFT